MEIRSRSFQPLLVARVSFEPWPIMCVHVLGVAGNPGVKVRIRISSFILHHEFTPCNPPLNIIKIRFQ